MTVDWSEVACHLDFFAEPSNWKGKTEPKEGQCRALSAIAEHLREGRRSLLLADEVGMGKTLIAAVFIESVRLAGGRAAVVIPPSLGAQWQDEIQKVRQDAKPLLPLRSFKSFLQSYAVPQNLADEGKIQDRRREELNKRRLQREWPADGLNWKDEDILLLSHNFGRRVGDDRARTFLEAVRKKLANTRRYRRDPKTGKDHNVAREAAECIVKSLKYVADQRQLQELLADCTLDAGVKHVVARGLGRFDIVIIDEAHKARGADSLLSRVLGDMTWKAKDAFWLGLTATPVELGAGQWLETLKRLAVSGGELASIGTAVWQYVDEVKRLQYSEALTQTSIDKFRDVADDFQRALSPWVVRRDKREDKFLQDFAKQHGSHRNICPAKVGFGNMPLDWKRAFLATEALSLLQKHELTSAERRARLSLPDGHNLGEREGDGLDAAIESWDWQRLGQFSTDAVVGLGDQGRGWRQRDALLPPCDLRAVKEIEAATSQGHKVLFFGAIRNRCGRSPSCSTRVKWCAGFVALRPPQTGGRNPRLASSMESGKRRSTLP